MKIAINRCFGGFSLSHAGVMRYAEIKGIKLYPFVDRRDKTGARIGSNPKSASESEARGDTIVYYCTTPTYSDDSYWDDRSIERDDPALCQTIEELGDAANGSCAKLGVVEVASGSRYRIDEYDGRESVMSVDDYDWKVAS